MVTQALFFLLKKNYFLYFLYSAKIKSTYFQMEKGPYSVFSFSSQRRNKILDWNKLTTITAVNYVQFRKKNMESGEKKKYKMNLSLFWLNATLCLLD
jgi:hypothetical protein